MTAADLQFVGYRPKTTTTVPSDCPLPPHVLEVCTVSNCLGGVDGWVTHWLHNEEGFFNTEADARAVVPASSESFTLFAYRMLPHCFDGGEVIAFAIGVPGDIQMPGAAYKPLGFDVANSCNSIFLECSPLSCNALANEVPVNEHCLLETFEEAIALAKHCAKEQPEPGDCYVVEVLRRTPIMPCDRGPG